MGHEFFRKYTEIVDEATRGVFNQGANVIRPTNQGERDLLAKGIKSARTYNRGQNAYTNQPIDATGGEKGQVRGNEQSYGATSSQIPKSDAEIQSGLGGGATTRGMPVDLSNDQSGKKWQTGAVNTQDVNTPNGPKAAGPIQPNQGKATAIKKPPQPW